MFGSLNVSNGPCETVIMTVDEYETIRLIDFLNLTQEECVERMNVARTTIQRIYNNARKKLAKVLIEGSNLKIEGGDYRICESNECGNGRGRRHRNRFENQNCKFDNKE